MAQQAKQWAAIIMMIALFAMIAFVTNLCSPMAVIVQNQFGATELESQIGNYANFFGNGYSQRYVNREIWLQENSVDRVGRRHRRHVVGVALRLNG